MYLSDLSVELNIPVKALISFLNSKNIDADIDKDLSLEEQLELRGNATEIRNSLEILSVKHENLAGPRILGKIDISALDASTRPKKRSIEQLEGMENIITNLEGSNISRELELPIENDSKSRIENTTPRLMAAAKTLNVGKDTIVDHLVARGFDKDELKPTARLTEAMYLSLVERFQPDRLAKLKSELLETLKSTETEETKHWKGIIEDISYHGKVKIAFINYERSYNNGKPIVLEKPDKNRWTFAPKEYWGDYDFKVGEKIFFSLQQIDLGNKKVRVAIPPIDKYQIEKKEEEAEKIQSQSIIDNSIPKVEERLTVLELGSEVTNVIDIIKTISYKMKTNVSPLQKILFGSPGTGKSHTIDGSDGSYLGKLGIVNKSLDCIKTVFHPEYTYGDFMGKLMPYTNDDGQVEYRFYSGHFLKALGKAYKNIIVAKIEHEKLMDETERLYKREVNKNNKKEFSESEIVELQRRRNAVPAPDAQNVALVIDEINRGNSAAIFGTTFQLLDREENGWSSYHVRISDLENNELLKEITLEYKEYKKHGKIDEVSHRFDGTKCTEADYHRYIDFIFEDLPETSRIRLTDRNVKIPSNLSIIATMNTSDNSIYFMDSAFKRRWDWEFIDITSEEQRKNQLGRMLEDNFSWVEFVDNLNAFIKKYGERIRKIEDKQIGYYFIKGNIIKHEAIKNKLMFFLWDSIFNNDKKPLKDLIGSDKTLVTFGDFTKHYEPFITAIKTKSFLQNNVL